MTQMYRQVSTRRSRPNYHLVPTFMIGIVCLVSLATAGLALVTNKGTKIEVCSFIHAHLQAAQMILKHDQFGLIPQNFKRTLYDVSLRGERFLLKHCPAEAIPAETSTQKKEDSPNEFMQQLLNSLSD